MTQLPSCAVYAIVHLASGRCYIGSSKRLPQRRRTHFNLLNRGKHHCEHLQRAWLKYGADAFELIVLEEVEGDLSYLIQREQFYIDNCGSLFNTSRFAGRPDNPNRKPLTAEARARIGAKNSIALKGRKLPPERIAKAAAGHRGLKRSAETCAKMSAAQRGKKRVSSPRFLSAMALRRGVPLSAAHKAKVASGVSGYTKTPEHRQRLSEAMKGRRPAESTTAARWTPELKQRQSERLKGVIPVAALSAMAVIRAKERNQGA